MTKQTRWKEDPFKSVYRKMVARCYDDQNPSFRWYGAKGVTVCDRWLYGEGGVSGVELFRTDMCERPEGYTLDRRDSTKPYEPDNCRWATPLDQTRNRDITKWVAFRGITKTLTDWCVELGLRYDRTYSRLYRQGWSVEAALTTPSLTGKKTKGVTGG